MAVASVLLGIAAVLLVLAFTKTLFLLFVAVPFGLSAYFMWYQASGRLHRRMRSRVAAGEPPGDRFSGFGAGARRATAEANRRGGPGRTEWAGSRRAGPGAGPSRRDGPSPTQAYRILGVDSDADRATLKRAYRRKVKEVHPDRPDGDEEAFKRVNRAYETLTD